MRLHEVSSGHMAFWCPGCKAPHSVPVNLKPFGAATKNTWLWNRSQTAPTLMPSLLFEKDDPAKRCHSFVKDGKIQFMFDSGHALKGQTVDIPDWDAQ
jgi:hypothetical protein